MSTPASTAILINSWNSLRETLPSLFSSSRWKKSSNSFWEKRGNSALSHTRSVAMRTMFLSRYPVPALSYFFEGSLCDPLQLVLVFQHFLLLGLHLGRLLLGLGPSLLGPSLLGSTLAGPRSTLLGSTSAGRGTALLGSTSARGGATLLGSILAGTALLGSTLAGRGTALPH